jgi:hypothetical protein
MYPANDPTKGSPGKPAQLILRRRSRAVEKKSSVGNKEVWPKDVTSVPFPDNDTETRGSHAMIEYRPIVSTFSLLSNKKDTSSHAQSFR